MASTTEQGHNRNTANYDKLISYCISYGATYNPNKAVLKIPAMQAQSTTAKNSLTTINALSMAFKNAGSARVISFRLLDPLITRVGNALKASDVTPEVNATARTIIRKLRGSRATPKKTEEEKKAATDAGKAIVENSSSQMSFDNRIDNLDKLIKLVSSIPAYAPNEAELKVAALTAVYTDLKTKNMAFINTGTSLSNARIARTDSMYKDNTGLVDVAVAVKTYIKSVYGATSPQYKNVSSLRFVKYKN